MEDKELSAWLCLCLTPGISSKNIRTLLQLFGSAEAVFNSQADQTIVQGKKLKRLLGFCRTQAGKPELKKKSSSNITLEANRKPLHYYTSL